MIALDTNVLVRFLADDDPEQSKKAQALLENLHEGGAWISDVVLCELVWVLMRGYGHGKSQVIAVLRQLLAARQLVFSHSELLQQALLAFEKGKGDFADYVIRGQSKAAGCDKIMTFDQALLRESGSAAP